MFVLDAGHVDGVGCRHHGPEVLGFHERHLVALQEVEDVGLHAEFRAKRRPARCSYSSASGRSARRTVLPPLKVAHHDYLFVVHLAVKAAVKRVGVEQRLGGVLVLAGAAVYDGDGPVGAVHEPGRLFDEAGGRVAHDDHIDVAGESAHRYPPGLSPLTSEEVEVSRISEVLRPGCGRRSGRTRNVLVDGWTK